MLFYKVDFFFLSISCFKKNLMTLYKRFACFLIGQPRDLFRAGTTYGFNPTQSGLSPIHSLKNSTSGEDDDENLAFDPMYTRMIPAIATIGLFLAGVFVIYIYYCIKQKKSQKK